MDSDVQNIESGFMIHCGNLSMKTTHPELVNLFSQVAPVIKIGLRKKDSTSKAYAFVTLKSEEDVQKVIEKFNYYTLHEKQMIITTYSSTTKYLPEANIFVKNLPPMLTSKDLYLILKAFGTIISCKVATDDKGTSKGFGFVQYSTVKAAKKAISTCQNAKISGYVLEVMLYDKPIKEEKAEVVPVVPTFTNCFVRNFPAGMSEESLKTILEKVGPVNSIFFPLDRFSNPIGYACVNFEKPEDAISAIEKYHGTLTFTPEECGGEEFVPTSPFFIQKAEKKKVREEALRKQLEKLSLEGKQLKKNLYVSNIPDTFSEDEISQIFSQFGTVTSIQIRKTSTTSNKQFGYVCFNTSEEAALAFEKVDGTFLDHNRLQISYYKNKLERAADEQKPKIKFNGKDQMHSAGISRLVQSLVNTVERIANLYKNDWEVVEANSPSDFSHKIAKEFVLLPDDEVKEMISSSTILEEKIQKILDTKRKTINNQEKEKL
ncbi:uncharacterized protein LOC143922169 [Arctopsyche grandis]|uniref:uncharacterized protein LOC143922169 n=1 Tax=Arctopsyche grandis TaxID=121162 RepID=UPI00406D7D8C